MTYLINQFNQGHLKICFGVFLMILSLASAKEQLHFFVAVDSIYDAQQYLVQADKESLIFIDVDSTLTLPSDPYLRRLAIIKHKNIYDQLTGPLTANQIRIFKHLHVMDSPSLLIEEAWPTVIKSLQERGIKTLALTAAKTGPIKSVLSSFPEWRYGELRRLGIDFSRACLGTALFEELEDFGGDHPGIEKGIIYCGHQVSKGDLLPYVLKVMKFTPSLIIFIDDKMENLESLSAAIQQSFPDIRFIGIHYTGMDRLENPVTEEDIFRQKFQALVEKTKEIAS